MKSVKYLIEEMKFICHGRQSSRDSVESFLVGYGRSLELTWAVKKYKHN